MAYGKSRYNSYRKRSFNRSDKQRREYAQEMDRLEQTFEKLDGWYLSSMKDSAYKDFGKYEIRLSNHSADNKYHDLENGRLIVNVKASKLKFVDIKCYYKGFKTKKDVI
ncbi:ORF56 [Streptococcus phage 01205]|uniref:ORF56 n=1 Tax=Streptococcus phage O1205 TaxID=85154 RepID=O34087_BPO12|nr:ORF56 [Streptococcus phage 01205]AAC79572.1 ORF56 [Streptococcus phage 01205]